MNLRSVPGQQADSTEAPRLSIVVLPFSNLSGDSSQDYFADGITEDLTTDLSRIAGSFVISRNTAFTFKGKAVDTRQIGRELGVRYVLEGSVRRMGGTVRVNAQLIDAGSGAHLWAEQMDLDQGTLSALQDNFGIANRLANAQCRTGQCRGRRACAPTRTVDLTMRGWSVLDAAEQDEVQRSVRCSRRLFASMPTMPRRAPDSHKPSLSSIATGGTRTPPGSSPVPTKQLRERSPARQTMRRLISSRPRFSD